MPQNTRKIHYLLSKLQWMQKKGMKMIMETKADKEYIEYLIDYDASSVIAKEPKEVLKYLNNKH